MTLRTRKASRSIAAATAFSLLLASSPSSWSQSANLAKADWDTYEGSGAALSYSPLTQINLKTVGQLEVAWRYEMPVGTSLSSPLIVDGVMYVVGNDTAIVALDAETGKQLWSRPNATSGRVRGLNYWQSKDGQDRRIIHWVNQMMMEIDAKTGQPIQSFGVNGKVDLREGLGRTLAQVNRIQPSTPGRIFGNLIIIGSITGEEYGSPPGDIRAYDVVTGKMVWTFHTIPHPGEAGYDQWKPDLYKTASSVNNWGGMALDEKRGIVYVPLGSASYDFYGVDRPGTNLYSNSLVALDARTGKHLWHFQTVHHDLWDYDLTTTPVLLTLKHKGKMVDAVVQAGKTGFLYVFDRVSGQPLWPIEERPVPKSDVPGEIASPTQPYPTVVPPFARQRFTAADIDPRLAPGEYAEIRARVLAARNEGLFTPPSMDREVVEMPGNHGGANWGLSGGEPNNGRYYVASFDLPALLKLELTAGQPRTTGMSPLAAGEALYKANCQICHGAERQGGSGIPELKMIGQRYKPAEIKTIVTEGRATMPAFGGMLGSEDVDKVVAYLTGLAPARPQGPQQSAAVDPESALAQAGPAPAAAAAGPANYQPLRYHSPYGFLMTSLGTPGITPPWSTLTAYDLTVPKILWQRPIGSIPTYSPDPVGTAQSKGGILITAGGLIFSSSNSDRKIHAWNKDTGDLVWEGNLPSAGQGRPVTYALKGRQYLAVPAAAWSQQQGTPAGNTFPPGKNGFVVFALEQK